MKLNIQTGAYQLEGDGITKTVKSALALNYGDVVVIDSTNLDPATGMLSVATLASADSALVIGVVASPGGIAAGGVGEIGTHGFFRVNTASASTNFAAGAALTTSATAGKAADGTETLLNLLGKVAYSPNSTAAYVIAFVNVL
jgi:hypothetical protein